MTTKTAHTPGPWKVVEKDVDEAGKYGYEIWGPSECAATLHYTYRKNARLIAAAPELLENLEIALAAVQASWFDMENGIQEHLRQANKSALMDIRLNIEAAIAKAKGDTP